MVAGQAASPAPSAEAYFGRLTPLLLLVVEPEDREARTLKAAFDKHFSVVLADSAAEALLAAGEFHPDVVLAAARLNDISSEHLVSTLRRHRALSIIIGRGVDDREIAEAAMRAGATVCVARPYQIAELAPLVRSLRPTRAALAALEYGPVRLDPESQRVFLDERAIDLPRQEFHLLHLLMSHRDRVLTREQIRRQLWPGLPDERSNTITVHIRRLRLRLGDDPWHPMVIATVRGKGYRFTEPAAGQRG
ncbi:MAG: response regulator transcription factor [Actinomycetota bacterium]|nr:response regulator transcription factor [Actinomycetota bacterium]